jgi:hypothetical protein
VPFARRRDHGAAEGRRHVRKKGSALTFVVTETRLDNQRGEHVCDLRTVIVVRNA